jgi:branched-chain amino acid transport system permease protein
VKGAGWIVAAIALVALTLLPLHMNGYWLNLLYQTVLFVGLAYGFNIISGYAGYFSFGQIAFFGIGAYTTGALALGTHWDWTICALIGGVLCGVLALPIGAIMLRLRGSAAAAACTCRPGAVCCPSTIGRSSLQAARSP